MEKIKEEVKRIRRNGWQKRISIFLWVVGSIGVVLFILLFVVMFNECVEYWTKMALGVGRKRDAIQFIGLGIAGVLAIFGAVAVNRRANAQVKENELVERGHVQERFKAAVEHLGHENESMRIASFYEFFRLGSDNKKLRKNIFDILRAHLRLVSDKYKKDIKFVVNKDNFKDVRTTEEMQSLLDVLFRSKDSQEEFIFAGLKPTLREIFLVGANLHKANLQSAILRDIDLRNADLYKADLRGANLWKVDLWDADLYKADLRGANLWKVDLWNADLREANLQGTDLRQVKNLHTANLSGAKVERAQPPEEEGFEWPEDVSHD